MNHKSFGWVIVFGCILSVGIAVFSGRITEPQAAQAYAYQDTKQNINAAQECQAIVSQLHTIRQDVWNEKVIGQLNGLAAMDDLIAREAQLDTSKCPADFRSAEAQFLTSQNTLSVDAHMDLTNNGDTALRALFDTGTQQYSQQLAANATDAMRHDLTATSTAAENFRQVCAKYGVK